MVGDPCQLAQKPGSKRGHLVRHGVVDQITLVTTPGRPLSAGLSGDPSWRFMR
jgi:hypothetical protein